MGGWRRVTHVQQYLFSVAGAGARSGTPAPEFPLSATKVIEAAVTRLLAAKLLPGVLELMPNACILAANGAVCSYSAVAAGGCAGACTTVACGADCAPSVLRTTPTSGSSPAANSSPLAPPPARLAPPSGLGRASLHASSRSGSTTTGFQSTSFARPPPAPSPKTRFGVTPAASMPEPVSLPGLSSPTAVHLALFFAASESSQLWLDSAASGWLSRYGVLVHLPFCRSPEVPLKLRISSLYLLLDIIV